MKLTVKLYEGKTYNMTVEAYTQVESGWHYAAGKIADKLVIASHNNNSDTCVYGGVLATREEYDSFVSEIENSASGYDLWNMIQAAL